MLLVCSSCVPRVLLVCYSCAPRVLLVCSSCAPRVLLVCSPILSLIASQPLPACMSIAYCSRFCRSLLAKASRLPFACPSCVASVLINRSLTAFRSLLACSSIAPCSPILGSLLVLHSFSICSLVTLRVHSFFGSLRAQRLIFVCSLVLFTCSSLALRLFFAPR